MKKTKILSFLLAVVVCSVAFVGFTKNMADVYAYNDSNITVGVSLPSLENEHMSNINAKIQSVFPSYNFSMNVFDAQNDANNQVHHIENFISQGVNAIVVMPVDEYALINALTEAAEAGIAIIIIGPNNGLFPYAIYVDFNYAGVIESNTEDFLNNHWIEGENAKVLVIACTNSHGRDYRNAIINKYQNYPSIDVIEIRVNDVADAYTQMQAWLAANDLPDGIFNCCDANAQAVKAALEDAGFVFGPDGIPVYGFKPNCTRHYEEMADLIADLIQKLLNGEISPTVDEATYLVDICTCNGEG